MENDKANLGEQQKPGLWDKMSFDTPSAAGVTSFLSARWRDILMILIVIAIIVGVTWYVTSKHGRKHGKGKHNTCLKSRTPCDDKEGCPLNDPTNPITSISNNLTQIGNYINDIDSVNGFLATQIMKVPDSIKTTLEGNISACIQNVAEAKKRVLNYQNAAANIYAKVKDLPIDAKTIFDEQLVIALTSSAEMQLVVVNTQLLSVQTQSCNQAILDNSTSSRTKLTVVELEKIREQYNIFMAKLSIVNDISNISTFVDNIKVVTDNAIPPTTTLPAVTLAIMPTTTPSQVLFDSVMPKLVSLRKQHDDLINSYVDMKTAYHEIVNLYNKEVRDAFSNSNMPGEYMTNEAIDKLMLNDDYNQVLLSTAIEPSVRTNHRAFASDRNQVVTGAGLMGIRDDPNDINPWVGKGGRPTYKRSDGSSLLSSKTKLESIPSDDPKTLMNERTDFF